MGHRTIHASKLNLNNGIDPNNGERPYYYERDGDSRTNTITLVPISREEAHARIKRNVGEIAWSALPGSEADQRHEAIYCRTFDRLWRALGRD
jgi:hypothetical protein